MTFLRSLARVAVFLTITVVTVAAGWALLVEFPESTRELVGILALLALVPVLFKIAGNITGSIAPSYNVAEVSVAGPISRSEGTSPLASGPIGATADRLVEQIERADADSSVEALLVHLNTPGGEIVPSEDIKLAAERFEGPTVAYATDTCASGGYEIASGCDEIWARNGSIVGSIGVIGSRVNAADLADRLGIEYEQLTAGEFKDAGVPLKELEEGEREYLQGIVDQYYDQFVENVAARRELEPGEVRDTEARVYLGEEAAEIGLVDELGTRKDVKERLEEQLGKPVTVERFEPRYGITGRLGRAPARRAGSSSGESRDAPVVASGP
ncbi:MAG: signal peptide peptidase SppA [Halobacteriales archaeon SW_8_66_22]|nr:MAG: signal peptide peptidase SppA [Halobacteriales archaeon SW_8_66_22]